jgi:hypothetical protein
MHYDLVVYVTEGNISFTKICGILSISANVFQLYDDLIFPELIASSKKQI